MNLIESNTPVSDPDRLQRIRDVAVRSFAAGMEFTPFIDEATGLPGIRIDSGRFKGRTGVMLEATETPGAYYFRKSDTSPV